MWMGDASLPEGYGDYYGAVPAISLVKKGIQKRQRVADPRIAEIDAKIVQLKSLKKSPARKEQLKRLLAKRRLLVGQLKASKVKEVADRKRQKKEAAKMRKLDKKAAAKLDAQIDAEAEEELAAAEEEVAAPAEVEAVAAEEGETVAVEESGLSTTAKISIGIAALAGVVGLAMLLRPRR
jgi:hypothetical protein